MADAADAPPVTSSARVAVLRAWTPGERAEAIEQHGRRAADITGIPLDQRDEPPEARAGPAA